MLCTRCGVSSVLSYNHPGAGRRIKEELVVVLHRKTLRGRIIKNDPFLALPVVPRVNHDFIEEQIRVSSFLNVCDKHFKSDCFLNERQHTAPLHLISKLEHERKYIYMTKIRQNCCSRIIYTRDVNVAFSNNNRAGKMTDGLFNCIALWSYTHSFHHKTFLLPV